MFKRFVLSVLMGGIRAPHWLGEVGLLVLRAFAGLAMASHGWGKLPPPEQLVQGVERMGFAWPGVFAWLAALSEFAGGILLAIGLLTRPAAFMIANTMIVAAFVAHASDPFGKKELALLYLAVCIAFLTTGAGRLSVDGLLRYKLKLMHIG
jgi:putative oxidoreductase